VLFIPIKHTGHTPHHTTVAPHHQDFKKRLIVTEPLRISSLLLIFSRPLFFLYYRSHNFVSLCLPRRFRLSVKPPKTQRFPQPTKKHQYLNHASARGSIPFDVESKKANIPGGAVKESRFGFASIKKTARQHPRVSLAI
tara:strand:- start:1085 stop:1501 length:417 start_codon:yes stop_codon:yes gene_type:complete